MVIDAVGVRDRGAPSGAPTVVKWDAGPLPGTEAAAVVLARSIAQSGSYVDPRCRSLSFLSPSHVGGWPVFLFRPSRPPVWAYWCRQGSGWGLTVDGLWRAHLDGTSSLPLGGATCARCRGMCLGNVRISARASPGAL